MLSIEDECLREEPDMCAQPVPEWPVPPPEGFTAEDLDRLPNLPPHTELIDGSLVLVSPQKVFHSLAISLLEQRLRACAPKECRARREMTVTLGRRQRPEPDVVVVRADGETGPDQSSYSPEDIELAVEVISPDSEERDRKRKPQLYAEAGIKHFWLVENDNGKPVVNVYELDPTQPHYALNGVYRDRLKLTAPFDIDIDLTEIERL